MKETHTYDTIPEPGFKERMERAIEPYRNLNPTSRFESVNGEQIIADYPNLKANDDFLETIYDTAGTIYDRTNSEK